MLWKMGIIENINKESDEPIRGAPIRISKLIVLINGRQFFYSYKYKNNKSKEKAASNKQCNQ